MRKKFSKYLVGKHKTPTFALAFEKHHGSGRKGKQKRNKKFVKNLQDPKTCDTFAKLSAEKPHRTLKRLQ